MASAQREIDEDMDGIREHASPHGVGGFTPFVKDVGFI
jgi:hypothetical protein